ncbi:MAG: hypothetical protein COY66_04760 [Candidatus Kerfeldbacteria bacterium CG_4_10_14_0_8_um_filter_42_10]|uniref:Ribosomal RNA large subunit methyltransferase K/L-like methyltransferase domain-containing protein n=1 Tax=Candidatus Kerfeldbacteria bacterium CG_4_10_14_0_8_um_filter_42_10 TaxID=2014248 RepID=A0A2M7RI72_9BACT|nr:MAG: hypothetical protein COY66_04760 [Candidatus Kerfeldbacteria bacterium CG_4_10_14_0_8_um_filter_42_10]
MHKYFFILGHSPKVSQAEIEAIFEKLPEEHNIIASSNEALVITYKIYDNARFQIKDLIQKLGGTIKIGKILDEIEPEKNSNLVSEISRKLTAERLLDKYFQQNSERINFGFSAYWLDNSFPKSISKQLLKLGLELKKQLKAKGHSVRLVTSREKALSSVIVGENKLMEKGADICFLISQNKIYLGKTLAVQEYKRFIERDYARPDRDAKSGMLPPKLARIMVNLSQARADDVLLDPFCGSGTILQEALLLGVKKVIGSDISQKAVQDTRSNLEWLINESETPVNSERSRGTSRLQATCLRRSEALASRRQASYQLINSAIQNLPDKLKEPADVIVTEPLLGPPLTGNESLDKIKTITENLSKLYLESFQVFSKILKKDRRIVIVFPIFKKGDEEIYLPIIPDIGQMGFRIQKSLLTNARGGLVYSRPEQRVMREIFIFARR